LAEKKLSRGGWTNRAFLLQQLVRIDRERPRLTPENDVVVDAIAGTLAEVAMGSKSMGEISVTKDLEI